MQKNLDIQSRLYAKVKTQLAIEKHNDWKYLFDLADGTKYENDSNK